MTARLAQRMGHLFGVAKVVKGEALKVKKPSSRILTYNVKEFQPEVNLAERLADLTPHQLYLRETNSMERPFTGHLWSEMEPGDYRCYVCNNKLFTSHQKFFPQTGMASFWTFIPGRVNVLDQEIQLEKSGNYSRFEATQVVEPSQRRCECSICKSHLGVVYTDGPAPTNLRFSINSHCLTFQHLKDFPDPNIIRDIRKKKEEEMKYQPISKW